MITEFALDLKVARRKAGLTQSDCAHLLGLHPSRISLMEHSKRMPSVLEICSLSLLYGRSFESLFASVFEQARTQLTEQLAAIPDCPKAWLGRFNRTNTLNALADSLEARNPNHHGSAA